MDDLPAEMEGARVLLLIDRESGGALGVALFESEEALRRGDERMSQGSGHGGTRTGVEFYEVAVHNL